MRRLTGTVLLLAAVAACHREKIHPLPTDEDAFTLTSSVNMANPRSAVQLVSGFHATEQNAWRWTTGHFAVTLKPPDGSAEHGAKLSVRMAAPEPLIQRLGSVTLTATAQRRALGSLICEKTGEYTFEADVPAELLRTDAVLFDFTLDRFLPSGTLDSRELGVIVSAIALR